MTEHQPCQFCRAPPHLKITDHHSGDVVCTRCGVVHEQRILDSTPEWRVRLNLIVDLHVFG